LKVLRRRYRLINYMLVSACKQSIPDGDWFCPSCRPKQTPPTQFKQCRVNLSDVCSKSADSSALSDSDRLLIAVTKVTGLPLGPLNTLKSLFKHLVPKVPISQKWSLKFLFVCNWQFLQIFLTKFYVYILSERSNVSSICITG